MVCEFCVLFAQESRMNKLLTALILFCFSASSFGEIYLCTSEAEANILDLRAVTGDGYRSQASNDNIQAIVDTSKGFRPDSNWEEYIGQCKRFGNNDYKCTHEYENLGDEHVLMIREGLRNSVRFVYSFTSQLHIKSYAGTCTKV